MKEIYRPYIAKNKGKTLKSSEEANDAQSKLFENHIQSTDGESLETTSDMIESYLEDASSRLSKKYIQFALGEILSNNRESFIFPAIDNFKLLDVIDVKYERLEQKTQMKFVATIKIDKLIRVFN